jgi:hypothetical protein
MFLIRLSFWALLIFAAYIFATGINEKDNANPANWSERLRAELENPRAETPKSQSEAIFSALVAERSPVLFRLTADRLVNCGHDFDCMEGNNDPPFVRDALPQECDSPRGCYVDTDNRIVPRGPNDEEWINCTTDRDCLDKHGHGMMVAEYQWEGEIEVDDFDEDAYIEAHDDFFRAMQEEERDHGDAESGDEYI